jgi:hypothetical protein
MGINAICGRLTGNLLSSDREMQYQLKRNARSRHLRLRVEPDGVVVVTAPKRTPKRLVDEFVNRQSRWVKRQQNKIALLQSAYPTLDWREQIVSYLGTLYYIRFDPDVEEKVHLKNGAARVHPVTGLERDMQKTLLQWLKQQAKLHIPERVRFWAASMATPYTKVALRQQKSRWGSCSTQGNLNFNWRLIHFELDVIDYVVIHELAHVRHHNHSRQFWQLVAEHDPAYKEHVRFLRNQHIRVQDM